ncbi:MAG TPA: ATP-binding protein [Rhodocyclaceae bacterium]|nr:ATP-binding protein [Rhodocyclaceae bacterium]
MLGEGAIPPSVGGGLTLDVQRLLQDYGERLVTRLRQSPPTTPEALDKALRGLEAEYAVELERSEDRGVRASTEEFNVWMAKLFTAVETGCSQQALVDEYLDDLDRLIHAGKSDALFALVIEQVTDGRVPIGYRLASRVGRIHPEHWRNFSRQIAERRHSGFLDALFAQEESLPLLLADWVPGYDGVFDSFARAILILPHGAGLSDRYWLTAVSLIAKADDEPRRIVFLAYRNIGSRLVPNPGKGARLETRVLDVLRIAYGQIDRQIATAAQDVAEEKENLVKTLLPSIYAHDFMSPVGNIQDWTLLAQRHCRELAEILLERPEETELKTAALETLKALAEVSREITRLHDYLHSYAGLDLKTTAPWPLEDGVHMALTLVHSRAQAEQVALRFEKQGRRRLAVLAERSLVVVVLVNLIHNAINIMALNATTERRRATQQRRILVRLAPLETGGREFARLIVANTDTDIAEENRERIFRKGFSTRGLAGGGRGLHLCRQVCAYLGGRISLMTAEERSQEGLPSGYRVAFAVRLPLAEPRHSEQIGMNP